MKRIIDFHSHSRKKKLPIYRRLLENSGSPDSDSLEKSQKARIKVNRAIVWINVRRGFFGRLLAELNIYGSTSVPTMKTNGTNIVYGVDFVLSQSDAAIRFVLCHEILHCVADHMGRRGGRDPYLWNVAADYAINPILNDEIGGDFAWPLLEDGSRMGLFEEKYVGMRAEDIYDDITKPGSKWTKESAKEWQKKGKNFGEVEDTDKDLAPPDNEEDIVQAPGLEDEIWDEIDQEDEDQEEIGGDGGDEGDGRSGGSGGPGGPDETEEGDPEEDWGPEDYDEPDSDDEESDDEGPEGGEGPSDPPPGGGQTDPVEVGEIVKIKNGPNAGKYAKISEISDGDLDSPKEYTAEILSDEEGKALYDAQKRYPKGGAM